MVVTNPEKTGKPGKTLFFSKSISKPEKSDIFLKNLSLHGKVREFSSEIPFNPFSILSLSIRKSRKLSFLCWMEVHSYI